MKAIEVENLGKRYRLGEREPYVALRDVLARSLSAPLRVFRRMQASQNGNRNGNANSNVWALRDVSFGVGQGETIGVIGRNGAGKSTLLKILSRITQPSEGRARIRGRVGSLLEVGTGFHPELTGRENVFLSGAILGMKKAEINRKFDEIVAFSGVETFLDTPLKHYSTGMQMRLAFSVAAHLEPEVLLVDEVLAVGDLQFQKKCLGKMGGVARSGRTVVLVSHNMNAILTLCSRVVWLEGGKVVSEGPAAAVTSGYFAESMQVSTDTSDLRNVPRVGSGKAKFTSLAIQAWDPLTRETSIASTGSNLRIEIGIEAHADLPESNVAVIISDSTGYRLVDINTAQKASFLSLKAGQTATVSFDLQELLLKPGRYFVGLWLGRDGFEEIDNIEQATVVDFVEGPETSKHVVVFPGPYLCRFESTMIVG